MLTSRGAAASASLRTRFTRTDDRLANEPADVALSERSRGLDDGVLLTPREGELTKRGPKASSVERGGAGFSERRRCRAGPLRKRVKHIQR